MISHEDADHGVVPLDRGHQDVRRSRELERRIQRREAGVVPEWAAARRALDERAADDGVRIGGELEPGDRLEFEVRGNELVGRKKRTKVDWSQFRGILADGRSTDEVMRELRPVRAWDDDE